MIGKEGKGKERFCNQKVGQCLMAFVNQYKSTKDSGYRLIKGGRSCGIYPAHRLCTWSN